jgi:hypothetical protein
VELIRDAAPLNPVSVAFVVLKMVDISACRALNEDSDGRTRHAETLGRDQARLISGKLGRSDRNTKLGYFFGGTVLMSKLATTLIVALIAMSCLTGCVGSGYSGSGEFWKRQEAPQQ